MADRAAAGIECRNLIKTFPGAQTRALDDVCLTIRAGEFFTLLGPSGCGKTTLLRAIGGFEHQDSGSILLDGVAIDANPPYRRPVNTVFQSYAVFPHMSVAANIAFGLKMQRCPEEETKRRVREMVALVRLDGFEHRRPDQLSGGQQQRVALARALAASPRVLLLDEPLSALDLKLRTEMQLELKRLQSEVGITFVFVTHDQTEALALSDRIAVMRAGKVLQVDQPQGIYDRPASRFVADFIGESNLLPAERIAPGRYRLGCGGELSAPVDEGVPASATLAIRPERVMLTRSAEANGLHATVEQIVYLGSDTIYHLRLADGAPVRAREQNRGETASFALVGATVGIRIGPEAAHVLLD